MAVVLQPLDETVRARTSTAYPVLHCGNSAAANSSTAASHPTFAMSLFHPRTEDSIWVLEVFSEEKKVKGEVGLDTWNCGSTEEWLRKYRILSRDMDEVVGTSQLCWNSSSSSLQRRSWLSMVFNKASLQHKRNLLWWTPQPDQRQLFQHAPADLVQMWGDCRGYPAMAWKEDHQMW